jgi:hypothetical protein
MANTITWYAAPSPEGQKVPEWIRSAGIREDGQVFVPAAVAGNESEVALCLLYDGTESFTYLNHTFVPAMWMAREFPATRELCEKIVRRVTEAESS